MEISSAELQEKINNGEKMVVDFWAGWCGPCRMLKPIFERVGQKAVESNSTVSYYTFDVESDKSFASAIGVRSIPTVKTFTTSKHNNKSIFSQKPFALRKKFQLIKNSFKLLIFQI